MSNLWTLKETFWDCKTVFKLQRRDKWLQRDISDYYFDLKNAKKVTTMLGNLVQMVVPHTPLLTETLKCGLLVVDHGENGVFLSRDPRILFLVLA